MNKDRRGFIAACGAFAGSFATPWVEAQSDWPSKPVRIVVPFAPGGGVDIAARLIAEHLRAKWQQAVVVDNRPGANTLIAAQTVLSAPADGYTLLATNSNTFFLPAVTSNIKFDPIQEFSPISELTVDQLVFITRSDTPADDVQGVLALASRNPGDYAFGSYGVGTIAHLLLLEINRSRQLNLVHSPYKGTAPLVQALMSGDVRLGMSNFGTIKPFIESGKIKPLAVTGVRRSPFLPNVPTLNDAGIKGFGSVQWVGLFASRGVDAALLARIAQDTTEVLSQKDVVAKLAEMATIPGTTVTDGFRRVVVRDAAELGDMSRAASIRLD